MAEDAGVSDEQYMSEVAARDKEVVAQLSKKNKAQALMYVPNSHVYIYTCIHRYIRMHILIHIYAHTLHSVHSYT